MEHVAALIAATAILVAIPGPNVALIVATSLSRGTRYGLLAVAGTTLGVALQLALTVVGLTALVEIVAIGLEWLRWLGVAYLVYLAIRAWRAPTDDLTGAGPHRRSSHALFWGGAGVAVVNPKTLLFNSAFLPQFVSAESSLSIGTQFILVAAVFLAVLAIGDSIWAGLAGWARGYLTRFGKLRNRLTSGFLLGASVALALSRR